jgi:hypothetical protein
MSELYIDVPRTVDLAVAEAVARDVEATRSGPGLNPDGIGGSATCTSCEVVRGSGPDSMGEHMVREVALEPVSPCLPTPENFLGTFGYV